MKKLLSIFILIAIGFSQIQVKVNADPKTIYEGDAFTLTVSAENGGEMPNVDLSALRDFRVASGPSQSTNMQWINGKMTSSYSLSWTLIPKKVGNLRIPILNINVGNKSFKSKPIKISVLDRSKMNNKSTANSGQKFFIEATVDNKSPYRGEQVTLTYTLYTKTDLSGFDILKLPRYQGFWTQELYSPSNLQLKEAWRGSDKWYASVVKKMALFPTKSGEIKIDPMTAVVGVREKGRRSFFFSSSKEFTIATNELSLNVKALPKTQAGRSGSVGKWNISTKIKSKEIKQDEALSFLITINGEGNIKTVDVQDINFPRELEVFEPEINIKQNELTDKISGSKTIEYILIPRYSGKIIIPSIKLLYFDLGLKKWRTKSTKQIALDVKENGALSSTSIGLTKKEVALLDKDIRYSDESEPNWRRINSPLVSKLVIIIFILSIILYFIPGMLHISRSRLDETKGSRIAKKAYKKSISILVENGNAEEIYSSIHKSLNMFMNLKLNKEVERSSVEIITKIQKQSMDNSLSNNIKEILDRGDAVRFAPVSNEKSKNDIENIKILLKELDQKW
ncbi:MAG: protein BatD [Candidatus Marinimicrobia bacterium]|nr:protein BatD [Candidatus Neomarinimicrobiota bacterium]